MTEIFVFGSNEGGRHGKGAALFAFKKHGATYGVGEGIQGTSYAIPTKDQKLNVLPLQSILKSVMVFLDYADDHPELIFNVTPIGCGLAGYKPNQIASMFMYHPENVILPPEFEEIINLNRKE